jgi:hypothetical protein
VPDWSAGPNEFHPASGRAERYFPPKRRYRKVFSVGRLNAFKATGVAAELRERGDHGGACAVVDGERQLIPITG